MIVKEIMYGVKCDRCGDLHDDGSYSYYVDEGSAREEADYSDWIEEGSKHYCTGCYDMDEESGKCKPKPDYPENIKEFKKILEVLLNGGVTLNEYSDSFELSGNTYRGFSSDKVDAVKLLLGDNNVEFSVYHSIWGISHEIKVKIKK